ncbi:DNA alkylation repair protein [Sphingomonas sp. So64.6b]|uniref:DNA alkylation repair protein n=1 Tax=Sphingomonas sp. So64.6b TaxID=2997354 RepID=UPI001921F465|nr:DNA alkylation repair protein [Sphingomonas sp. So64.6b]
MTISAMDDRIASVIADLRQHADAGYRDDLAPRYGIIAPTAIGVRMADIKAIAKRLGRDHPLALALWASDIYEARLLVSLIADPVLTTPEIMDAWRGDFDNWALCDALCFNLFDRTPHALDKVRDWSRLNDEFGRRAAFALLASVALHDRKAPNAPFLACLPLIEAAATDPRNFVKKGVSWALRAIGERNVVLNRAATELAERLAASDERTERWIGKDALKSLTGPKLKAKFGS